MAFLSYYFKMIFHFRMCYNEIHYNNKKNRASLLKACYVPCSILGTLFTQSHLILTITLAIGVQVYPTSKDD
jgi:hypothetical protein